MGPPSNLHLHPMMPAPQVTLGRGGRAGRQASVVRAKSHSSKHDCVMKLALSTKKGPPGCFRIYPGRRVRGAPSLIYKLPISLSTEIGLFYPQEESTVLDLISNLLKCFLKSQSPSVPMLHRFLFLLPLPHCCITLFSLHP